MRLRPASLASVTVAALVLALPACGHFSVRPAHESFEKGDYAPAKLRIQGGIPIAQVQGKPRGAGLPARVAGRKAGARPPRELEVRRLLPLARRVERGADRGARGHRARRLSARARGAEHDRRHRVRRPPPRERRDRRVQLHRLRRERHGDGRRAAPRREEHGLRARERPRREDARDRLPPGGEARVRLDRLARLRGRRERHERRGPRRVHRRPRDTSCSSPIRGRRPA